MHFGRFATTQIIHFGFRWQIFKNRNIHSSPLTKWISHWMWNQIFRKNKTRKKNWLNTKYQMSCFSQSSTTFGKIFEQFHASLGLSYKFLAFNLKCQQPIIIIIGPYFVLFFSSSSVFVSGWFSFVLFVSPLYFRSFCCLFLYFLSLWSVINAATTVPSTIQLNDF